MTPVYCDCGALCIFDAGDGTHWCPACDDVGVTARVGRSVPSVDTIRAFFMRGAAAQTAVDKAIAAACDCPGCTANPPTECWADFAPDVELN